MKVLQELRNSCLSCVRKHLAQALVLMGEVRQGYPAYRWIAIGHMAEAGDECCKDYPKLAAAIRAERLKYMADPDYAVPVMKLIEKASNLVNESADDFYAGMAGMAGTGWKADAQKAAAEKKADAKRLKRRPLKTLRTKKTGR